jgi:hypothetical protein
MTGKRQLDPDQTYHLQVRIGAVAHHDGLVFGDRATLQIKGSDVTDELLAACDIVEPHQLPDVALRPEPGVEATPADKLGDVTDPKPGRSAPAQAQSQPRAAKP